jgi:hypothetical protein
MPAFIDQYLQQLTNKRERFAESFDPTPRNASERSLAEAAAAAWLPLPEGSEPAPRPAFAVDGASALRPLMNGASFLVCQSLLVGPETEESLVAVEVVRGGDGRDASRALDRLRQFCEFQIAVDNLDRMRGGMLLVDGSLLSDLSHMLYLRPMRLGEFSDLRAALVDAFLRLVEGCRERDILLVGISKSARDSLLVGSLLDNAHPRDRLCDAEILHRFVGGKPGYTRPILFGTDGTAVRETDDGEGEMDEATRARVSQLPCIAVFYVRLAGGEDALRVDVTGDSIGCESRLLEFARAWAEPGSVAPVVRRLMAQHGGASVYNAPLYAADRMVRLSGRTVDGPYMALLREATGALITSDRGTRRFQRSY